MRSTANINSSNLNNSFGIFHNPLNVDKWMLFLVSLLLVVGGVIIYSSSGHFAVNRGLDSEYYLKNHAIMMVIGLIVMTFTMSVDYRNWYRFARIAYWVSIVLLVVVLFSGVTAHGATRWIKLGPIQFQPSELAKMSLILLLASKFSEIRERSVNIADGFWSPLLLVGLMFFLILLQPNYSTGSSLLIVSLMIMFLAGTRIKYLFRFGLLLIPMMIAAALFSPYRFKRVLALYQPGENANSSYQQLQAMISLGNGGVWGTGLGESTQKLGFLPMPFTDTIYAILGEELGFIGALLVLLLFGLVIYRGIKAAQKCGTRFGSLLAFGLITSFAINVFMHVGVCIRLLPATGQPLPLVSFGGTNLIVTLAALGVVLSVSTANGNEKIITGDGLDGNISSEEDFGKDEPESKMAVAR